MKKAITKQDVRGIEFDFDVEYLLGEINAKGDINGRNFGEWWFKYNRDAADARAMSKIVWQLTVNNIEKFGFRFNEGTEAQLNLEQVARFVGDKLNVWWETVVRWYRGMTYSGYNIDVCDRWGLNELYVKF